MSNRALLIAFHFPPFGFSSGIHRTLKNVQYLPEFGWEPLVLTATPRAYESVRPDGLAEIPPATVVRRAFCLDTARHLAIGGRYMRIMAMPDRWISWWFGGVLAGLDLIRRHKPAVIWSTFPIATAQLIGLTLHRLTGVPWIADVRDSMTEGDYPRDPMQRRVFGWVEKQCLRQADAVVFTTAGAARMHAERYPDVPQSRIRVIENGYDEETFHKAATRPAATGGGDGRAVLVHSGILYPEERDPTEFFAALSMLKEAGSIDASNVRIVLRATGHDAVHAASLERFGIADLVELAPQVPYAQALREMLEADGLLIFQAANCNNQIPAKIYEYFRAGRPIFALTDAVGDTATLLRSVGIDTISPLDDRGRIAAALLQFLSKLRSGAAPAVARDTAALHSRRARARELAALMEDVRNSDARRPRGAEGST